MHLHTETHHTPPVEDGFAREDFTTPVEFQVIDMPAHSTGNELLAGFVLYADQNPANRPGELRVVHDTDKPLVKH